MIVRHWSRSGVAWVFWRIREVLRLSGSAIDCDFATPNLRCESYGIGGQDEVGNWDSDFFREADVVHFHHDYVWQREAEAFRARWPKKKAVVTIHGEPDRDACRRGNGYVGRVAPDAYHCVEPGLSEFYEGKAPIVRLIPNHPARELADREDRDPAKRWARNPRLLFVPHSHVLIHKDPTARDLVALHLLNSNRWRGRYETGIHANDSLLAKIQSEAAAVWVQLQGYLDLLTMEAWSLGALPIVLRPTPPRCEALRKVWGSLPSMPFSDPNPDAIASAILGDDGELLDSVRSNSEWMRSTWNERAAARLWEDFYEEVA